MTHYRAAARPQILRAFFACALATAGLSSCILKSAETTDSMTEREFVQMHANCGGKRVFLFAHVEPTIRGRNEKDWGCWYAGSTDQVFASPNQQELAKIFSSTKPVVRNYVNLNTLTKRLMDVDSQRSTVLWLGVGVALLGCGVATAGTFGIALAGCALLGSAPAMYDVFGGDPSQGASEAWKKFADMKPEEMSRLECNAVKTISEQARFIDLGALPKNEGASRAPCPSVKTVIAKNQKILGLQAGSHEVKNLKPTFSEKR